MGTNHRLLLPVIIGLALCTAVADAAVWDRDKEKVIAERLAMEIDNGQIIWLKPLFGDAFPAIADSAGPYARTTAIILLHGMGGHPDWPVVISPLRQYLQAHNWSALSIQMPILKADRSPSDYGKTLREAERRIDSAIDYLNRKHYRHVVLLGYGFGAATAIYALANDNKPAVNGLVAISILARKFLEPGINLTGLLEKLDIPILDIYASNDKSVVVDTADDRRLAARRNGGVHYTQEIIAGTDHYYTGQEPLLLQQIVDWLEREINTGKDDK
ncbi:MAG TPA: DUF3530 family protein [Gammaproteobacteria bacterium]|nr:DUF3530 family protein [Gammaproteobacteria bacterium]